MAAPCNDGTSGPDIITRSSGVCDNVNGLGDNDTITIEGTVVVDGSVSGGDGDDTLLIKGGTVNTGVLGANGDDTLTISGGVVKGGMLGAAGKDKLTISGTGDVSGNMSGGADDDELLLAGGSLTGDMLGAAGIDKLTVSGGMLTGNMNSGTEDDELLVSGGTVTGYMFGNTGKDKLTVTGGTVKGNIDGGSEDDELHISAGSVEGSMLGAAGVDKLTVDGTGKVGADVDGGDGNDTITVADTATVGGKVLGGAGVDKVQITGGTITGDVSGEADDDTIDISGGEIGGKVLGGSGLDKLTITGGTVKGDMDGGTEDDELRVSAGTVEGSMLGGAGVDKLTIDGTGKVGTDVNGGDGNDTITIAGTATVGGKVLGGAGEDDLKLTGGTVALNVETGADDDTVDLNGTGISGDVLAEAGDDKMTWKSGTIAAGRKIDLGAGTDSLDLYGTGAGGTAQQANLASLDGGDGEADTLNLHGLKETLTQLNNWENINLIDNSIGNLGPNGRMIDTEKFFIDDSSVLVIKSAAGGQVFEIDGDVGNDGVIDMAQGGPAARHDEFSVTGNFASAGETLIGLDTYLGGEGSPSDFLRVGGAVTGDPTGLVIIDSNPGAGAFNPTGIELVRVEGPAGSTVAEDFYLVDGPIEKGLWTYDLGFDDTRANPGRANADVHVLYTRPDEITQFTPYFATAALTIFEASLASWIDRQHTLQDTLATNRHVTPTADIGQPVPVRGSFVDLWAAPFGIYREVDADSNLSFFGDRFSARMDYDQTVWGLLGGIDAISVIADGEAVMAGFFGGYLSSTVDPEAVAVSGEYEGGTIGAYGSYLREGLTLSAVGKIDFLKFGWESSSLDIKENADVDTWGGRIEAAYKLALGEAPWLEPYGNLTYAHSSWDKFSVLGTEFDLDGNESLVGRLGLRIGADFQGATEYAKIFAGAGVAEQFEDGGTADLVSGGATLPLSDDIDDTALEVLGGLTFGGTETGLSIALTGTGQFSDNVEGYGGKATLNYQF